MQRIFRAFLFWSLLLCACSTSVTFPQSSPPTSINAPSVYPTTAVPNPTLIATLRTPPVDPQPDGNNTPSTNPQDCGYQWANQDLPELSSSFLASIQALQPEARANAYAFGENCMLADGSAGGFSAMETDFNISLQVNDLANESDLGEWIVKVMQVIENIPKDQIVGPQPGRVSIGFVSGSNQKSVNFYINQYQALPAGLSNSDIYHALQTPQ